MHAQHPSPCPRWWHRALPYLSLPLLAILFTWPLVTALQSLVYDWHDPLLNAWIMAWEARQLLLDPRHLFDANIFYPYPTTLAFSETLFGVTALVLPLLWSGSSALTAHNVAFLLAFAGAALGAYLLALHLTRNRLAALAAALIYAFAPYRFGQLSQVQLLTTGWLPLALLYLDYLLSSPATPATARRDRRNARLFGLFFVLQALSSFYAALFTAAACSLYGLGWLLLVRRALPPRATVVRVGSALLVAGTLLLPVVLPYREVNQRFAAGWTLAENETFSAPLQAFAHAPDAVRLWRWLGTPLDYRHGTCCAGTPLWPGLITLLLAGLALWRGRGQRRWLFLLLIGTGALLALGPTLQLRPGEGTLTLPYTWLFEHVPGFNALRAPVRWSLLMMLGLSMLAAWGAARHRGLAALAIPLLLVEFATFPLPLVHSPSSPPEVAWLAKQPPTRILELPLSIQLAPVQEPTTAQTKRLVSRLPLRNYFSIQHWHTTPDGYSGYIPPSVAELDAELCAFPSERSLTLLQQMGIEYVMIHGNQMAPERAQAIATALPQHEALHPLACWQHDTLVEGTCPAGGVRAMSLAPPSQPSAPLSWSLLDPVQITAGQAAPLWLALAAEGYAYTPADQRTSVTVTWRGPTTQQQSLNLTFPQLVEEAALVPLPLTAPNQPGEYELLLEGGPTPLRASVSVAPTAPEDPLPVAATLAEARIENLEPGQTATVRLDWRYLQYTPRYFQLTVQAVDSEGSVWAQPVAAPAEPPTLEWCVGRSYGRSWQLDIPAEAVPPLHLNLLWHDEFSGQPALLWHEGAWRDTLRIEPRWRGATKEEKTTSMAEHIIEA